MTEEQMVNLLDCISNGEETGLAPQEEAEFVRQCFSSPYCVVRESAIYAGAFALEQAEWTSLLAQLAANDSNAIIRRIARTWKPAHQEAHQ